MDKTDWEMLSFLQEGIPLVREPFSDLAERLGITPDEAVERLRTLQEEKVIRKFGLFVWKSRLGVAANAMVVWKVPSNRIQDVAEFLSEFREVTHCYQRRTTPKWRYNLYTMIHGREREGVTDFVKRLSDRVGVRDYAILFSVKEFVRRSTGPIGPSRFRKQ
ncbi:MAG TPA: AsnC family transcriptional regulator [archaeon]|nr:AsnC family transcriptional regulator [archaeon]